MARAHLRWLFALSLTAWAAAHGGPPALARPPEVIDLDVAGADLRDVVVLLADVGHVSLVIGEGVTGTVTVRLRRVHWRAALDSLLAVHGCAARLEGGVLRVGRASDLVP